MLNHSDLTLGISHWLARLNHSHFDFVKIRSNWCNQIKDSKQEGKHNHLLFFCALRKENGSDPVEWTIASSHVILESWSWISYFDVNMSCSSDSIRKWSDLIVGQWYATINRSPQHLITTPIIFQTTWRQSITYVNAKPKEKCRSFFSFVQICGVTPF